MTEFENADRVHWESTEIEWDGAERFRLVIPHYIHEWPAVWLDRNAEHGLRSVPGCEDVLVTVTNATPSQTPGSVGWDAPGYITVSEIHQPFPDHVRLRDTLNGLVDDAYKATKEVQDELDPFLRGLRSGR